MADSRPVKDLSKDPTYTVAMGMKLDRVSQDCWKASCDRERRIREEWQRTYRPDVEERDREIVQRYLASEAERKQRTLTNPARSLLLDGVSKDGKGRLAYLKARRDLPPQERFGLDSTVTSSHEVGWRVQTAQANTLLARSDGVPSYGRKPGIKNGFFRRTIGGSLSQAVHS